MGSGKPRGMRAGRKLKDHRRVQRWNDDSYNGQMIGRRWKNVFMGSSHAKGIVVERIGVESKQPNSAIRKCVRVQLRKNGKKVAAFVPRDGMLNIIHDNDEVLIAGFGRKGKAVGDLPGIRFKVVQVKGKSIIGIFKGKTLAPSK
jgi:small subunit ribosomal protein S23e